MLLASSHGVVGHCCIALPNTHKRNSPSRTRNRNIRRSTTIMEARLSPEENWDNFWSSYKTPTQGHVAGWVGKFVSFSPAGVAEEDVRFQDVWLRTFQEAAADGKFRMQMIRRADQAAKSWPRAGRERADGNDETVLEGTREDSCSPAGFWHPYGRGANVPPTRVVSFSPDALAQVTLRLPSPEDIAAAQAFDFMGGAEATFIHEGLRWTLAVTYKGEGGGSMLFHQTSWDPVFVPDVDPEQPVDLLRALDGQVPGPELPADPAQWLGSAPIEGSSQSLRFLGMDLGWERLPPESVVWAPPSPTEQQVLFRYPGGAYGLYPKTLTGGADLVFEAGVLLKRGLLWRYVARYKDDGAVDTISWQMFSTAA